MNFDLINKLRKFPVDSGPCRVSDDRFVYLHREKFRRDLSQQEIIEHLSWQFHRYFSYNLDLERPCTFNEKLNWLKVFYRNPLMTKCVDKAAFPAFVLSRLPKARAHLVKRFGVLRSPAEMTPQLLAALPERFIVKSSFGCGAQTIVEQGKINMIHLQVDIAKYLDRRLNQYFLSLEWPYKDVPASAVVEEVLDFDYKIEFYCFDGEPFIYWVLLNDKTKDMRANLYTMRGDKLDCSWNLKNFHRPFQPPPYFDELAQAARALSAGFPHVRVDFFAAKDTWHFSELTFFKGAGITRFSRYEMDILLGKRIDLAKIGGPACA